ncbi:FAD-dependent monooxygenase [Microbulbifer aggregans]|uniref:FAD-dependent monooxygenase n=1 Tax=Microbulbifer aggregans TaxID=1769779 RepID=UPI001CFDB9D0|nr:FAD-dependent monooxygenase [Microbulbifer aggregans]
MTVKQGKDIALIIGAGTGGLLAAAALAPHFKTVRILERDTLPDVPAIRKGAGQAAHLHSLLLGGLQIMERFLPGITQELTLSGAKCLRAGIDQQIHEYGIWLPERDLGCSILAQSRYLLEHVIRSRVTQLENVSILDGVRVGNLTLDGVGGIAGVRLAEPDGEAREMPADIVVDCSGRGGKFVRQLNELFPGMDRVDEINSNIVYASAIVDKPESLAESRENILIIAEPGASAGGALLDIEDGRWFVSLHGRNGLVPPTTPSEWVEFARQLPADRIYQRLIQARKIHPVALYKKPLSTWRRFDLMPELPFRYFPLGDVITSVNPTFGQGMTVGFGHAEALHDAFSDHDDIGLAQSDYIKTSAAWSQKAWRVCAAYDSSFDGHAAKKNYELLRALSQKKQAEIFTSPDRHLEWFQRAQMYSC